MTRRNSWIRRVIAVGLAAGMVMSTASPALAERAEGYESSVEAENNFEDGDSATSLMPKEQNTVHKVILLQKISIHRLLDFSYSLLSYHSFIS